MSKYWAEYDYDKALERALDRMPKKVVDDDRFEIPNVDSSIQGNRTFWGNFGDIASFLNRKTSHLLKFMNAELGTSGNVEGGRAIFQGKHNRMQIKRALDRYLANYVYCPTCSKPDTRLEYHDRILMIQCDACGASQSVKQIK